MSFLVSNASVFYWIWLLLLFLRVIVNTRVLSKQGDQIVDEPGPLLDTNSDTLIVVVFTFWFSKEDTQDKQLIRLIRYTNFLHSFFTVYSVFIFILFLITYGK